MLSSPSQIQTPPMTNSFRKHSPLGPLPKTQLNPQTSLLPRTQINPRRITKPIHFLFPDPAFRFPPPPIASFLPHPLPNQLNACRPQNFPSNIKYPFKQSSRGETRLPKCAKPNSTCTSNSESPVAFTPSRKSLVLIQLLTNDQNGHDSLHHSYFCPVFLYPLNVSS